MKRFCLSRSCRETICRGTVGLIRPPLACVLLLCLFISRNVTGDDRPQAYLSFCGTVYRSNSSAAAFLNVDGQSSLSNTTVDAYVQADFQETGEPRTYFAGSDGKPVSGLAVFRKNVILQDRQFPLGIVFHPVQESALSCDVEWRVFLVPSGTPVSSPELLQTVSITVPCPTRHVLLGKHLQSYMEAGMVRMFKTRAGIRVFARIHDGGTKFSFYVGDDAAARFTALKGPKLILISGLGCDIKAWAGNFEQLTCTGQPRENDHHLVAYPALMSQYAAVGFFDYPSSGPVNGPDIAGALARDLADAPADDRIDLIGHSMGGMVVRSYIEQYAGYEKIDHAVLLQTPQNGVTNSMHKDFMSLSPLFGTKTLNGILHAVSPLAELLQNSDFIRNLNRPWENLEAPASTTGFGPCEYFAVAAGIYGSGNDPKSTHGWVDYQSDSLPEEIRAESALYLPLGDGRLGELDQTGQREILLISPSKEMNRYIQHGSFVAHMADDEHNGSCKWILSRLWPDPMPPGKTESK